MMHDTSLAYIWQQGAAAPRHAFRSDRVARMATDRGWDRATDSPNAISGRQRTDARRPRPEEWFS